MSVELRMSRSHSASKTSLHQVIITKCRGLISHFKRKSHLARKWNRYIKRRFHQKIAIVSTDIICLLFSVNDSDLYTTEKILVGPKDSHPIILSGDTYNPNVSQSERHFPYQLVDASLCCNVR